MSVLITFAITEWLAFLITLYIGKITGVYNHYEVIKTFSAKRTFLSGVRKYSETYHSHSCCLSLSFIYIYIYIYIYIHLNQFDSPIIRIFFCAWAALLGWLLTMFISIAHSASQNNSLSPSCPHLFQLEAHLSQCHPISFSLLFINI